MPSLLDLSAELRSQFEARLSQVIPAEPESLYTPVRQVVAAGGKRVRPLLTALSYQLTKQDDGWIDAGIAIELLHTFTLVHDDIMDNASTRRGQPTVHAQYGTSEAILAGDVMIALAQHTLAKDAHSQSAQMLQEFSTGFIRVCEGQAYDKEFEHQEYVSVSDYIRMIDLKTAKVLETAAVLGALAAGDLTHVEPVREFAHHVGIAFQIQDDLLDLTAEHPDFGKTIGGDILEGKRTYLLLKLIEKKDSLPPDERARVERVLAGEATEADIEPMRTLMRTSGVLSETEAAVEQQTDMALGSLSRINADTAMLRQFAEQLVKRSY